LLAKIGRRVGDRVALFVQSAPHDTPRVLVKKALCAARNAITTGAVAITDAASRIGWFVGSSVCNARRPSGKVKLDSDDK
jgi:hypothetical protein